MSNHGVKNLKMSLNFNTEKFLFLILQKLKMAAA